MEKLDINYELVAEEWEEKEEEDVFEVGTGI